MLSGPMWEGWQGVSGSVAQYEMILFSTLFIGKSLITLSWSLSKFKDSTGEKKEAVKQGKGGSEVLMQQKMEDMKEPVFGWDTNSKLPGETILCQSSSCAFGA